MTVPTKRYEEITGYKTGEMTPERDFVPELYEEYTAGFLSEVRSGITAEEARCLHDGAIMMTLECGMRFLTDYLEGDTYFRTTRPGQNLDRARTQIKLVADMENRRSLFESIIAKHL